MPSGEGGIVKAQAVDFGRASVPNMSEPDITAPAKASDDLKQAPLRRGHTDSDLLAAETTPPRDTRGDFNRIGSLEIEPADEIWINSDYYGYMHEELQEVAEAIPSGWFKAAQWVTRPQTAGGVEHGARWIVNEQDQDYVRYLHYELAKGNFERFKLLRQGKEIPGLEGLRGKELDYALVELEQQEAERITDAYWKGRSPEQRVATMERLSRVADPRKQIWHHVTEWLGTSIHAAVRKRFAAGSYDNNQQADRVAVGKALIDILYEQGNRQ